jgi:protein involved in sex pheromone biosynthesis
MKLVIAASAALLFVSACNAPQGDDDEERTEQGDRDEEGGEDD